MLQRLIRRKHEDRRRGPDDQPSAEEHSVERSEHGAC
jgi:hypothetical protein